MLNTIKRLKDKGVIVVWLALFLLFLLLALAGMAIDGSYLYFAKNQLQVAADSAVLAGVGAGLSGNDDSTSALQQTAARQAAWKFACKNTADQFNPDPGGLNNHVYLVSDFGLHSIAESDFVSKTCDDAASSLTASQLNGSSSGDGKNNPDGDIVVGHWTLTKPTDACGTACSSIWEQAGAGFFCPATGSTTCSINAIKAVARRTGDAPQSYKFGRNPVRLFLGQIMRLIGANWSFMNITASAIAGPNQLQIAPFPACLPSCSINTPVNGQWGYQKSGPDDPILCTDQNSSPSAPPGQKFFLNPSAQDEQTLCSVTKTPCDKDIDCPTGQTCIVGTPVTGLAWTNFYISDCGGHCDEPNKNDIEPYFKGTQPPDVCNKRVCTSNGDITNLFDTLEEEFDKNKKSYNFVTGGTTTQVTGWQILVPIVSNFQCGSGSEVTHACPGDRSGNPYLIKNFVKVLVTEIISSGKKGIRLIALGDNPPTQLTTTVVCGGVPKTIDRWVSSMSCVDCGQLSTISGGGPPKLVK